MVHSGSLFLYPSQTITEKRSQISSLSNLKKNFLHICEIYKIINGMSPEYLRQLATLNEIPFESRSVGLLDAA